MNNIEDYKKTLKSCDAIAKVNFIRRLLDIIESDIYNCGLGCEDMPMDSNSEKNLNFPLSVINLLYLSAVQWVPQHFTPKTVNQEDGADSIKNPEKGS